MVDVSRKFFFVFIFALVLALLASPAFAAKKPKTPVFKPSSPEITSISSTPTKKKNRVNITVTISLPQNTGSSPIFGSRVSAKGVACTINKTKTSCTIKNVQVGRTFNFVVQSRNKVGFGAKSAVVRYVAGSQILVAQNTSNGPQSSPSAVHNSGGNGNSYTPPAPEAPISTCTISGTPGNDVLVGTNGNDVICGFGGIDDIDGLGGDDVIYAESDLRNSFELISFQSVLNPKISMIATAVQNGSTIKGGSGNDRIYGSPRGDLIKGGDGKDVIRGGKGDDDIQGDGGDDDLDGDEGDDSLIGGPGNNKCSGGSKWWLENNSLDLATCGDVNLPIVENFSIDYERVNSSNNDAVITADFTLRDDLSGVKDFSGNMSFYDESTNQLISPSLVSKEITSGNQYDLIVSYKLVFKILKNSPQGEYTIYINPTDKVGNFKMLGVASGKVLQVGSTDPSLNRDNERPVIVESEILDSVIDTSESSKTVRFRLKAVDDFNGVQSVGISAFGPSGLNFTPSLSSNDISLVSGNALSGIWEGTITFPRYSGTGTWEINAQPNDGTYSMPRSSSLGRINQSGIGDSLLPVVSNITATPSVVYVGGSSQNVVIRFTVADNLSGIKNVSVSLFHFSNGSSQSGTRIGSLVTILDSGLERTYETEFKIERYASSGTWNINVNADDNAGNWSMYPAGQGSFTVAQ